MPKLVQIKNFPFVAEELYPLCSRNECFSIFFPLLCYLFLYYLIYTFSSVLYFFLHKFYHTVFIFLYTTLIFVFINLFASLKLCIHPQLNTINKLFVTVFHLDLRLSPAFSPKAVENVCLLQRP